ncbi:MAG: dihydropteroate synthase [Rhizobacter sp.]|nr:dihydropteroate synthase [Chlorobiales bacterium]
MNAEAGKNTEENFILDFHGHRLNLSERPAVMSVLNLTPDSFYDGGKFHHDARLDIDKAIEAAEAMVKEGASIIDVGGESSRPQATPVSIEEEISRTVPVIERLVKKIDVPVSIDTYKAEVAKAALKAGAAMVNDISGFRADKALPAVCERYDVPVVLMHLRQMPGAMAWSTNDKNVYADLVEEIKAALRHAIAVAASHNLRQVIIDVGFGFGKSVAGNYELLRRLRSFHTLGKPVLAGLSRKSFIGRAIAPDGEPLPDAAERLFGTVAANTIALMNGAHILRVHDTKAAADAVRIFQATMATVPH